MANTIADYPDTPQSPPLPSNSMWTDNEEYKTLRDKVHKLANNWQGEIDETRTRRELRYMRIDIKEKRSTGELKADEIITPVRVINDNIIKEQAQYYAYLTTSRNTAIFKPKKPGGETTNVQPLEEWFTKISRYNGWETPHFQTLDGMQTHGWDFVEVVLDESKPGHFSIEHISHENAWFPLDIETYKLQDTPLFVRNCKITEDRVKKFKDVNLEQVEKLFKETEHVNEVHATSDIQKVFYKKEGIVYVCWMNYQKCDDFIRAPKPLFLGRKSFVLGEQGEVLSSQDIYETQYPIEVLPYIVSEDGMLKNIKGRAFFDEYLQEAVTSMTSSIVNGWHRASLVMGAPKNGQSGAAMAQTDVPIEGGRFFNQAVEFFHMDYPDPSGMTVVNALLTQNKQEAGQINYAVGNRNDYASRKTAKEIQSAESQAALLSGVQVTLYSIFLRNVYTRCWAIAQSRAQQGLLEDMPSQPGLLNLEYELFPAGDTEVIQREENKQNLLNSWPVVSTTPAAPIMLEDLLIALFPQNATKYITALRQGDPKQFIGILAGVLGSIVQEHPDVIPPQDREKIGMIIEQANVMSGANDAAAGQEE